MVLCIADSISDSAKSSCLFKSSSIVFSSSLNIDFCSSDSPPSLSSIESIRFSKPWSICLVTLLTILSADSDAISIDLLIRSSLAPLVHVYQSDLPLMNATSSPDKSFFTSTTDSAIDHIPDIIA